MGMTFSGFSIFGFSAYNAEQPTYGNSRSQQGNSYDYGNNSGYGSSYRASAYANNGDSYEAPFRLVAENEHARLWGDPHIVDADGGKYDFMEEGTYNILEDKGINVNGTFEKAKDGKSTYMTEGGLVVNGNEIHIDADGTVTIGTGEDAQELEDGETVQLGNGSKITKNGDKVTVTTPEYKVKFTTNKEHEGNQHMDVDVYSGEDGVESDGVAPTGLLGETFDENGKPQKETQGYAEDYERESLFQTGDDAGVDEDQTFNTFG